MNLMKLTKDLCGIFHYNYTLVCPPEGGDNPQALDILARCEIFCAEVCDFWQEWYTVNVNLSLV